MCMSDMSESALLPLRVPPNVSTRSPLPGVSSAMCATGISSRFDRDWLFYNFRVCDVVISSRGVSRGNVCCVIDSFYLACEWDKFFGKYPHISRCHPLSDPCHIAHPDCERITWNGGEFFHCFVYDDIEDSLHSHLPRISGFHDEIA